MAYLGLPQLKASDIRQGAVAGSGYSAPHAIGWSVPSKAALLLRVNGVSQHHDSWTLNSTNTAFTLTTAPASTDAIEWVGLMDVGTAVVPAAGTVLESHLAFTIEGSVIGTEGKYFENYASITSDLTTAVNSNNQGLIGPIAIAADWTVAGDITVF